MSIKAIKLDDIWLYQGPPQVLSDLRVNGRQLVQVTNLLRSSTAKVMGRGNRSVEITWTVNRLHESLSAAQQFMLAHPSQLPADATLLIYLADDSTITLTHCVVTNLGQELTSIRTTSKYSATAAAITLGSLAESTTMYSGTISLATLQTTVTVTGLSLPVAPKRVWLTVQKPDSAASNLFATVRADSITPDGFVADLSAAPENDQFKLNYLYLL